MRKLVAPALVGLGTFLLVAAIVALVVTGSVKKTPLDVDTTTRLAGEAAKLDPETGDLTPRPIFAQRVTQVDSEASTDDDVVWASWSCAAFGEAGSDCLDPADPNIVIVPEEQLITADSTTFATDRVTAEGVDTDELGDNLPADATQVEGVVNKFPFDTEKKTYPYWESTLGTAVDAVYDRTETLEGVETYVFRIEVDEEPVEIAEGTPGTYSDVKEIFVEPATGAILNQTDDQQRWLEDGTQVLDLQLAFTDEQVSDNVADAKDDRSRLTLITKVVPIVGFAGGAVLILLGLLLAVRSRRKDAAPAAERPLVNA